MPELPEVETTCRGITPHLLNHVIQQVVVYERRLRWPVPDDLPAQLQGQRILRIERRGKYILLGASVGTVIIHLGMSGSLRIVDADTVREPHDHIDILLDNAQCLRLHDPRRFGCVLFTADPVQHHSLIKVLGVEPLQRGFNADYMYGRSRGRKLAIKLFIMNSHIVVGVGNIYASEALFLAGIHPSRAAGKITRERYRALVTAIKQVLRAAIKQGGTTLRDFVNSEGKPGYFRQKLRVYERDGAPCVNCRQPIRRRVLGQRATYYCSHCQT
ncbi:MAG: bifunctional DNA-formamidopyrimidine glycosylase/DNA-(apurinic or apyrimidinic site) lyase [Gammaproteobacteria bacterium]|nr:bifunctional DNA-formamidopyrimidine glycosylase/DNA-(apurinic or apyrimidinic site) lyase [Gammaproteobacteria bacterium]